MGKKVNGRSSFLETFFERKKPFKLETRILNIEIIILASDNDDTNKSGMIHELRVRQARLRCAK